MSLLSRIGTKDGASIYGLVRSRKGGMVCPYRHWGQIRYRRHALDAAAGTAEGGNVNEKTNN